MSKKSVKNYKQFPIDTIEEGTQALGSLISNVIIHLKKYKEYFAELEQLLVKYDNQQEGTSEKCYIPSKEYEDINDKLLFRQRELLKFIADHQDSSFSYINLRKYLERRRYIEHPLDLKIKQILSDFLDIRNMTFHNPQSRLVAVKESATKRLPKELVGLVKIEPQLNPVLIDNITHYELIMLMTLVIHVEKRIKQFEFILENMKADYTAMYERATPKKMLIVDGNLTADIVYKEVSRISCFDDIASDIAQISMAIQKSRYDGSDESFNKWVIKKTSD